MISVEKQGEKCQIFSNGNRLGEIELYENPFHGVNCYAKVRLTCLQPAVSEELWHKIKEIAGRPLQVMVDSSDEAMIRFLSAGGFQCRRKCYEVDACAADYIGSKINLPLFPCSAGDPAYESCCRMMYCQYLKLHEPINPWTGDFAAFCDRLPQAAVYAKNESAIESAAFLDGNEIAYVCSLDKQHFFLFAQSLLSAMFNKYDRISFECDDCDWTAMTLKNFFVNQGDACFCTYLL